MTHRIAGLALLITGAVAASACGEEEVATRHIRSVLSQVSAPASDGPADDPGAVAEPVLELPNGDTLHVRESVVEFYRSRDHLPAWTDDDEILARGRDLLEAIGLADTEGLDRDRYHYSTAREMARLLEEDAVEQRELDYLGNLDLLLTESFARLSQDLAAGTIDPENAGLAWRIERGTADVRPLLDAVLEGQEPRAVLATVRPHVPYYDRMVKALGRLRAVEADGGWPGVPDGEPLGPGDEGPRVGALRARLAAGDDPEETRLARTGAERPRFFDDDLAAALRHFQTRHTLHEDGTLGPNTVEALNVPVEDRIAALRLNLDRWRWLPSDLGERFILVNIAGFELEVVRNDSAIEAMNVVVGETANRTPVFQDTLEHMVVNPYWNVPASIATEEILPEVQSDPSYLARNRYEVVRDGQPVRSATLTEEALENGELRIRQTPGPGNALGHVKFLFPNGYDIYLHDTPADHLFSQESRAFSHGCIRVERPDDLARVLLDALTDRDPSTYETMLESDSEQWIPFDEKIPVYILYFTAWVDRDGTIRFHPDIYERDRMLEQETEQKLGPVDPRPIASRRNVAA
jgi:murein L,D-transpeptidase YcbB/YkuD